MQITENMLKLRKQLLTKEKKRMANKNYYEKRKKEAKTLCPICCKSVDTYYYDKHLNSKLHLNNVETLKKLEQEL